jgi:hypothetical protein
MLLNISTRASSLLLLLRFEQKQQAARLPVCRQPPVHAPPFEGGTIPAPMPPKRPFRPGTTP